MVGYNALNKPEEAHRIWTLMQQMKFEPDLWSYVEAANSHLNDKNNLSDLINLISDMIVNQSEEVSPTTKLPGNELNFDVEDETTQDASHQQKPPHPLLPMMNKVLARFADKGHIEAAFQFWHQMREKVQIEPDNRTALLLIRACVRGSNITRGLLVGVDMKKYYRLKVL